MPCPEPLGENGDRAMWTNPGPPRTATVPGLQRITSLRSMLRCARDTRDASAPNQWAEMALL
jgi:hypothetical protein